MTEQVARMRGAGGAVFALSVPSPGTHARELFDAKVAAGELVAADVPDEPRPRARKPTRTEPDGDA